MIRPKLAFQIELEERLSHLFQPLYFTEEEMVPEKFCDMSSQYQTASGRDGVKTRKSEPLSSSLEGL